MNISTLGVTLLDLKIAVKETLDKIAFVMPMNAAGLVCGSVTCGILMEYVDYQIILMISLLLSSFATAFIPWNRNLWHLCANFSISGFLIGFISLGGNTWILHLWGKESPSFMQAYHFAFGLGSFIAPLIAAPFLLPLNEENTNVTKTYTPSDLKIQYAYGISAFTMLICEVLFILIFCLQRTNKPHPTLEKKTVELDQKPITTIKRLSCVILTCIFMFFFYGLELSFGSLLPAYLVNCVANVILMLLGRTNELTLVILCIEHVSVLLLWDLALRHYLQLFLVSYRSTFIIPLIIGKSVESTPELRGETEEKG
ncbi:sodium-dependent glucose transporter 1-like protein [Dinothrombium tinctorium]|uniref:Sodium-dependent glucose transporter 1-like protein n=1 Tax=Dinothrombium tinctorium TaxID=1965070 RepID=A0A3S3QYD0_9ACAR|nr:sodium-dependent glucose transporter 1-like protein [Dinothrombium tinctorium]